MVSMKDIERYCDAIAAVFQPQRSILLLRFLAMRLRKERALPKPRIYSEEELASMIAEDEADGERFRQSR